MRALSILATTLLATLLALPAGAGIPLPGFSKVFSPDTIGPGSVSRLVFTIDNPTPVAVTDLAFEDVLPAGMVIATPANASWDCGGALTAPAGGTTITFTGASRDGVAANDSCTISVDVTAAAPGGYANTSGPLSSSAGTSLAASDDLTVATDRPGFAMAFDTPATGFGSTVRLTYTIDNSANAAQVFNPSFRDELTEGLRVASPPNLSTSCAPLRLTADAGADVVSLATSGAILAGGQTCELSVDVHVGAVGTLVNVTGPLTSTTGLVLDSGLASAEITGTASTDAPILTKEFVDDPAEPDGSVTLRFSIQNPLRDAAATLIAFSDDLEQTLSGLVATGLPANGFCGAGSQASGASVLDVSIPSLAAGEGCSFDVVLGMPTEASSGRYTNRTSDVLARVDGVEVTGDPASNLLTVDAGSPRFTRSFSPTPVATGALATIEYEIVNPSSSLALADLGFTDVLAPPLGAGIVFVDPLPLTDPCGPGSSLFFAAPGTDQEGLTLTGGSLPAFGSCSFSVSFEIAPDTPRGVYATTSSPLTGTLGGEPFQRAGAPADLSVVAAPLRTRIAFTDDPAGPLETVTLEFQLENTSEAGEAVTDIAFSDNLAETLDGLVATGLPAPGFCGPGSLLTGTAVLEVTGASLAAGASCAFSVALQVPVLVLPGSYPNQTSLVAARVGGVDVESPAAVTELRIKSLAFSKSFTDDPVKPGDPVTLEYTIENETQSENASAISFSDDLGAVLPGLQVDLASVPPTPCGGQLVPSGNSLFFVSGALAAGASCSFAVTLAVPGAAEPDTYASATSSLQATIAGRGLVVDPAADALVVAYAPNDLCSEPTLAGGEGPLPRLDAVDTLLATDSLDDPVSSCGTGRDGATVWYLFVPPETGRYEIDTTGSDYDTVVSVWAGAETCGALATEIACNDDDGGFEHSYVELEAEAGESYRVQIGARNLGEGGALVVRIPEPSALWQALAALGAVAALRRRAARSRSPRVRGR